MTDDGLTFTATIMTDRGDTLHRETPNRRELLEWLAAHGAEGTITRVGMEATGPEPVAAMLRALVAGQVLMDARRHHAAGATHDCGEWRGAGGRCDICGA